MSYNSLSYYERGEIDRLVSLGNTIRYIARELHRVPSTISDEIKRNCVRKNCYDAGTAQQKAETRKKKSRKKPVTENIALKKQIQKYLLIGLSPSTMKGRTLIEKVPFPISVESIYTIIYNDASLSLLLPSQRKKQKKSFFKQNMNSFNDKKVRIDARPSEIDARISIGHCETDCIIGKNNASAIQTTIERKSRFLFASKLSQTTKEHTQHVLWKIKKAYPDKILSFTADNGSEFSYHALPFLNTFVPLYFTYPHRPWEKGSIEHANKLLRRYFKKGSDLSLISDAHLSAIVDKINHTPRKILGYKSPFEVFFNTSVRILI